MVDGQTECHTVCHLRWDHVLTAGVWAQYLQNKRSQSAENTESFRRNILYCSARFELASSERLPKCFTLLGTMHERTCYILDSLPQQCFMFGPARGDGIMANYFRVCHGNRVEYHFSVTSGSNAKWKSR
jgi:hypothetical protein